MSKNKDKKFKIEQPYLLLCEGMDEFAFLINYLGYLMDNGNPKIARIQVDNYGGITDLTTRLKVIKNVEGFNKVQRIAVMRDAETNWQGAMASVATSIKAAEIPGGLTLDEPYLLPCKTADGTWQNGTLEDLAVEILNPHFDDDVDMQRLLECSKNHVSEVEKLREKAFPRKHKNVLHTLFAGSDKYVGLKIGEASKAGAFDWQSPKLDVLKEFLNELVK